jgi:hypothetical protein
MGKCADLTLPSSLWPQLFVNDFEKAEHWYRQCTSFDPERVDCPIFLARLYTDWGKPAQAWQQCIKALSSNYPVRRKLLEYHLLSCLCCRPLNPGPPSDPPDPRSGVCVSLCAGGSQIRAFGNNFYIYDCFTPIESVKAIQALLQVRPSAEAVPQLAFLTGTDPP